MLESLQLAFLTMQILIVTTVLWQMFLALSIPDAEKQSYSRLFAMVL